MNFSREVFAAAGLELVPLQLFSYRKSHHGEPTPAADGCIDLAFVPTSAGHIRLTDIARLCARLARERPDVVFVNGWRAAESLALHLWCKARVVPVVLVSDSTPLDNVRRRWKDAIKSAIVRNANSAFTGGSPQRGYVMQLGMPRDRIFVGCDVVDNAHFSVAVTLRKTQGFRVLTVARLAPEKNLIKATAAFLRFVAQRGSREHWSWTIVGHGSQQQALARLAADSKGAIKLHGYADYAALPELYAAADLYWQPSVSEPWGLVINEAMASGLPILASVRCGCVQDLVTAGIGWTFDPTSVAGLVGGLDEATRARPAWRDMGAKAAQKISAWDLARFAQGALLAAQAALTPARR